MKLRFVLLLGCASLAQPSVLVQNGAPKAVIVLGSNASADERRAAAELQKYIEKVSGAKLPVGRGTGVKLLVGPAAAPAKVKQDLAALKGDGYVIESLPDGAIALAGAGRAGTSYAVYRFLERVAGVRWLWPGDLGEVVPKRATIEAGQLSAKQDPAYIWRNLGPGGALWGADDKWTSERKLGITEAHQAAERLWEKRNGYGGEKIYGGHAMGEILPPAKYGRVHPEYFALVNGKRAWEHFDGKHGAQPCTTNPDVIRIAAEYSEHFFEEHPDYDAFAISLNDGGGFCECDRCRRLDTGALRVEADDPEGGRGKRAVITDRIITFANEVAGRVAKKYPEKKLILFAYGPYKTPPVKVKVAPNVIIQYTYHASFDWNPAAAQRQLQETGAWSSAAKNLGVYEYFIQGNSPDLPRLMLEPIGRSVRALYDQGYRYYQTQAGDGYALNGLNWYTLARLLWDPSADVNGMTGDYVEAGFGSAAPAVKRYFERMANQWKSQKGKQVAMDAATASQYKTVINAFPPDFRAACRADLAEAYRTGKGIERDRVRFLERGLEYLELTMDAVEKTYPLIQAGWKFAPKVTAPADADMAQFRKALEAWEARDQYVENRKQSFELAYFWIRYNDQNRTFVPLLKMRQFAERPPFAGQVEPLRKEIRETFSVPDPLPVLQAEVHGSFEPEPGVTAERVTYATEFGMRVPAILYHPAKVTGKIPAIVIVNGHGGDKYAWYAFYSGVLYARAGAAVLTYDPMGEGERNIDRKSETRAHDKLASQALALRMGGLMMTDLMQAVSYLSSRPEVDSHRIAATGYSLGSYVVTMTCAVDQRIRACVPVGGGNLDGPMEYWDHTKPMCTGAQYRALSYLGDRAAVIYALHAARGATLIYNGTADDVVAIPRNAPEFFADLRRRAAALRGSDAGLFETDFKAGTSHRPYFVTRPVALWLERQLDFPNWTEASIKAMPETRIGDWAKANGVEMDRLYATEVRESGTNALGKGIPALTREQLTVLPADEWAGQKEQFILEGWIARASK